jgi:hypothetical protein
MVYVFQQVDQTWNLSQKLVACDAEKGGTFGFDIDLNNDIAVVSGLARDYPTSKGTGICYVFALWDGLWMHQGKLETGDAYGDHFSSCLIALDGDNVLKGTTGDGGLDVLGGYSAHLGAAHLFQIERVPPIDHWRLQYFGSTDDTGLAGINADPNANGVSNLLEFAFGLNPVESQSFTKLSYSPFNGVITNRGLPRLSRKSDADGNLHTLTYARRLDFKEANLLYATEFSEDLATWYPVPLMESVVGSDCDVELIEVTFPEVLPNGGNANHARIRVTQLPE